MKQIIVDHEKCIKDYLCISECPCGFIFDHDESGFPILNDNAENYCIACYHCVAVCPHNALSFTTQVPKKNISVQEELLIDAEKAEHFLKTRRSYRTFKKKQVSPEILSQLIDVTRWAPTALNNQPIEWLVVHNHKMVSELAELVIEYFKIAVKENNYYSPIIEAWKKNEDVVLRKAPHLIIAHLPKDSYWADIDSGIALTYLELMSNTMGLGACWAGYFARAANSYEPLKRKLDLPANNKVGGAMMIGYRSHKFKSIPHRNQAKIKWLGNTEGSDTKTLEPDK